MGRFYKALIGLGIISLCLVGCGNAEKPHEHNWGNIAYVWSSDYSTCKAERVCLSDSSHKETEIVNSTYQVVVAAQCEKDGIGRYTATFANEAFTTQTSDITITATGHRYANPTYTWSSDYSTCKAERVCLTDSSHKETETVNSKYQVVVAAQCEVDGTGRYTATFTNSAFTTQTSDITITATGHRYANPTYTWSSDYSSCTAERVCLNDNTHKESETKTSTSNVISDPDCVSTGLRKYDVTFENSAFTAQSHEEIIPALGHNLIHHDGQAATCTESGWTDYDTCSRCDYTTYQVIPAKGHTAGTPVQENVVPATCTESGSYESVTYCVDDGVELSRENRIISALGHDWGTPTYEWSSDYSTCTATRICSHDVDASHVETETVNSTFVEITPASYTSSGERTYTAAFANAIFTTQTKNVTIDQLHYYGEFPILSEDGKTLTYGLYPQTNVNDSDLVTALNELTTPESNGWYLYDNEYYAKVSATPHFTGFKFNNGTTIVSGTTYWFKCEPIIWNVLSDNNGEYYILSSVLLDAHRYDELYYDVKDGHCANNYEYSEIRAWLNNDFYNSTFALGSSHIQTTTIDNSAATTNSTSNSYACNYTQDKVFLPSYKDYFNSSYGFSTSNDITSSRCCKTTDWARARGSEYNSNSSGNYNGYYWTRSPSSSRSYYAWYVSNAGDLYNYNVDRANFSVRPALTIKIV